MCCLGACFYHTNHRVLKMKTHHACPLCKDTGVVVCFSEYPNLIDSRWCHLCEAGGELARKVGDIIARTLGTVRAA